MGRFSHYEVRLKNALVQCAAEDQIRAMGRGAGDSLGARYYR